MVFVYKKIYLALNRDVKSSLQGIPGIGLHKSLFIESKVGLRNSYLLMNKVNIYLFRMLEQVLHSCTWLKARITRQIFSNISNLISIRCYKGFRHKDSLPVRGQRTRTNAGTQKKKRYAIYKKTSF